MAVNRMWDSSTLVVPDATALRQVLETITPESCPHRFNFHLHTVCSDGRLQPEHLIEQAMQVGLEGLAITDHHSVDGFRRAQQRLSHGQHPQTDSRPTLWSGVEISARLLNSEVHILAYAFDIEHEALHPYLQGETATGADYQADRVIAAIHAANGLAVLAHPARYRCSPSELIPAAAQLGIDGVETYYAYNNPSPWQPSPKQTREVRRLGERFNLLHTCGTDSHGLSLLQRL